MLNLINDYIKYLYYLLGLIIFILIIILLTKVIKISHSVKQCTDGIDDINNQIKAIKEKYEYITESFSTSWLFFIEAYAIIQILEYIFKDYETTSKDNRSIIRSSMNVLNDKKYLVKMATRR